MTSEQLVRDGLQLVEHLCARLGQERLLLLSSSAGTMLAVPMAQLRPERLAALVLTDLNVDMRAGEILGHRLALARLRAAGHRRGVAALESIGAEPCYWDRAAWQRKQAWLMTCDPLAGGLGRSLLLPSLIDSPLHSLRDLGDFAAGLQHSQATRFVELMAWDARYWGRRFEVPFFWFHGERDVLTPTALAEDYVADVDAPVKDGALIPDVGHLCAFAAPDRLLAELLGRVRPWLNRKSRPRHGSARTWARN